MKIIKNIIVAFSLYSKIPMPIFEWKEEDMRHNLIFLPLVGCVIAGLCYITYLLLAYLKAPELFIISMLALLPILVTGGFHLDGFMDVKDALSSYADKEKKIAILKDPHIGAFSVIHFAGLALVWIASLSVIGRESSIDFVKIYAISFVISRIVCAALSLRLKKTSPAGMLSMETKSASTEDFIILIVQVCIALLVTALISYVAALIIIADIIAFTFYFKKMAYKNFDGISGDLSGFGIVLLETVIIFTIAVATLCL